jgi:integrase
MGGIRKRGSSYEINYRDADRRRHFETIDTDDPDIAKDELKKREGDIAHGLPVTAKMNTIPFIELARDVIADYDIQKHRSRADIEARFRLHILPVFGDRKASSITTAQLRSYIAQRQDEGAKVGTINRELEAIRRAYCLAINERRLYIKPHIPMLEENNARQGFFERHEFDAIRRHLPEPIADASLCGYITGWRVEEIGSLQIQNVDLEADELRLELYTTKNDDARVFPMNRELRSLVEKRLRLLQTLRKRGVVQPYLFWYENSKKQIRRLKRFDKAWATAAQKAGLPVELVERRNAKGEILIVKRGKRKGLPKLRKRSLRIFHDFRRTACRNLIRRGIPEKLAMQMVGWKDRAMIDRYHIVSKADLDLARKLMDGEIATLAHSGPPPEQRGVVRLDALLPLDGVRSRSV